MPPINSRRHVLLCQECDRELASFLGITALLGAGVSQVAPPASDQAQPDGRNRDTVARARLPVSDPCPKSRQRHTLPVPMAPSTHRWMSSRAFFAPILGALLVLVMWTAHTHQQLSSQRDQVSRLERQNDALTVHLGSLQAGQQFFGNSGFWMPLSAVDANATEAGGIVMSGDQNTTTLLSVWNMPNDHDTYHVALRIQARRVVDCRRDSGQREWQRYGHAQPAITSDGISRGPRRADRVGHLRSRYADARHLATADRRADGCRDQPRRSRATLSNSLARHYIPPVSDSRNRRLFARSSAIP